MMRVVAFLSLCAMACLVGLGGEIPLVANVAAAEPSTGRALAVGLNERMHTVWHDAKVVVAERCDDASYFRRVTLDLAGRIPVAGEFEEFLGWPGEERRQRLVDRLLTGPEFPLHWSRVIDSWVMRKYSGDGAYVEWLRRRLAAGDSWEALFSAMLVGPWEKADDAASAKFLAKRVRSLDSLTADASRAFFGVDITCARCHDHPLASDWKQDHYYGLAAFFIRTNETARNSGKITEKADGEVSFDAKGSGQKTAPMMFLSGQTFPSEAKQNRRELLVRAAKSDRRFLSRAAVNRVWAELFGQGLVHPVDQIHSGNPAAVPGVLEWLGESFAERGFDLRDLVGGLVLSDAYQRDSRLPAARDGKPLADADERTAQKYFAVSALRPLAARPLAVSLVLAAGGEWSRDDRSAEARDKAYRQAESATNELLTGLDSTTEGYQASVAESLFLANHAAVQTLCEPKEANLAARLLALPASAEPARSNWLDIAFQTVLGRPPAPAERALFPDKLPQEPEQRTRLVADLVWSLLTSAEFRFNH